MYQIYPRSFNGEDGPEGTINGIRERLDYLQELGINAVWISPFYPSPMVDSGYDIADYTDIDPRYGTLTDFERMIDEAHERGIMVKTDLVPNHTSDQHEWFQASKDPSHPDYEAYKDFYIWKDPADDDGVPNNWGSVFSIPNRKAWENGELGLETTDDGEEYIPYKTAWHFDEERGQYYLADFAKEQPNLNWHNPEVREAMKDVVRFWIDKGVDGFRVDVVDHIGKDPQFRDDEFTPDMTLENPYDQTSRDKSIRYLDTLLPYVKELTDVLDEYTGRDLRLILEAHADKELLHKFDSINPSRAASFNFGRLKAPWDAKIHKQLLDDYYENLPEDGVANQVNGNHDMDRLASRVGPEAARVASLVNIFLPGMITLYNGEELGLENVDVPEHRRDDKLGYRDMARCPMPWSKEEPSAGFSTVSEDDLWLPLDPDWREINAEVQARDPHSSLNLYKRLLATRNGSELLKQSDYTPLETSDRDVLAFARRDEKHQAVVVANFSGRSVEDVRIPNARQHLGRVMLSTQELQPQQRFDLQRGFAIAPNAGMLISQTA